MGELCIWKNRYDLKTSNSNKFKIIVGFVCLFVADKAYLYYLPDMHEDILFILFFSNYFLC
jgi:hypothetical protein